MVPGLVSITFRHLPPLEILKLCTIAGLQAIEWGGDVHVPAGNLHSAKEVVHLSEDYGIIISSYGSYFHLGQSNDIFYQNLETALELGAPVLRFWAGTKGAKDYTLKERAQLLTQLHFIHEEAEKAGVVIAPEFHMNTLTDSIAGLSDLLVEIPNLHFYWQPRWDWPEDKRLESLKLQGERNVCIHVFSWEVKNGNELRLPLVAGKEMWQKVFSEKKTGYALLEFVQNDDPNVFFRDAETLISWTA